ncbi:MAG: type II secretion system protein GspD [Gemmatimonadaceae bacterium]|nr:type II secretion system protein GspD [Gemmatimonadaceae bacterium]
MRRVLVGALLCASSALSAQVTDTTRATGDSVSVRLIDVELRTVVQSLARYLDRPLMFGTLPSQRVSFETPSAVPRTRILTLLAGLLESNGLRLVVDTAFYSVRPVREPSEQPAGGDSARARGPTELFVVRLRHARASEVAATVNSLYGRPSSFGEIKTPPSTLGGELRANLVPEAGTPPPQAVAAIAGREASFTGEVTIMPDPRANSLLVRATRSDFELIEAAVRELDVRPLQVLIELLIAEVRRDRSLSFGVESTLPKQNLPSSGTSISASTTGLGLGDFVLRLMEIGGVNVDATLRAAASRGDVTIVSRPVVITANNQPAQILVGSQRPFVQVSRALPTDSPLRDQVVQYKEVGTKLSVLPTISDDGYVMLEVTQEVNAATAETQFDAPVISTRHVQTRLLVRNGQTVALGGLTDQQRDQNRSGVPILSGIPIIGGLFGKSVKRTTETELFLFLTPRVLRSDEDADSVTTPMKTRAERLKP